MATVQKLSTVSKSDQNNSNTNIKKNPAQLEIVECESDDSDSTDSKTNKVTKLKEIGNGNPLLNIPLNTGPSQNLHQVDVSKCKNVQFGSKTYLNGDLIIKQYFENKAVENKAYIRTECENSVPNSNLVHNILHESTHPAQHNVSEKKVVINKWYKVLFLILCLILSGAVLTFVIVNFYPHLNEDTPKGTSSQFSTIYNVTNNDVLLVMVGWYLDWCVNNLFVIIVGIVIFLLPQISLLFTEDVEQIAQTTAPIVTQTPPPSSSYKEVRRVPFIIAPNHLRIVPRSEWLAQPPEAPLDVMTHPTPWVIIAHTAAEPCESQSECILRVRLIQNYHVESRGWFDIGYNYLVGGDGSAYYGRGWDFVGAHTKGYNRISIGIAFIGTFNKEAPPQQQLDACMKLIALGVKEGKIAKDYKLLAHRQLMSTRSPGDKLYEILKTWPHFVHEDTDVQDILPKQI